MEHFAQFLQLVSHVVSHAAIPTLWMIAATICMFFMGVMLAVPGFVITVLTCVLSASVWFVVEFVLRGMVKMRGGICSRHRLLSFSRSRGHRDDIGICRCCVCSLPMPGGMAFLLSQSLLLSARPG